MAREYSTIRIETSVVKALEKVRDAMTSGVLQGRREGFIDERQGRLSLSSTIAEMIKMWVRHRDRVRMAKRKAAAKRKAGERFMRL